MPFMQKQQHDGPYWSIESRNGTTYLPDDIPGCPLDWPKDNQGNPKPQTIELDGELEDSEESIRDCFGDYVEDGPEGIRSVEYVATGTLYRLSAPGYMDCTDWTTDPDSPEFDDDSDDSEGNDTE